MSFQWDPLSSIRRIILTSSSANTTVQHSNARVDKAQLPALPAHQDLPAEKIDASIDKWFFISGASA